MKRHPVLLALVVVALAATALPALADDPSAPAPSAAPVRHGLARLKRCLSVLDLSSQQQGDVQSIVSAAKPTIQADIQAVRADHKKLASDIDSSADKSVIGQDAIDQHTDASKLKSDAQAVRDQILAKLTPDQQNKFQGCAQAIGPRMLGSHRGGASKLQ